MNWRGGGNGEENDFVDVSVNVEYGEEIFNLVES